MAAGWAGAIAAALVQMTAAFAGDEASAARAAELRTQLLRSADDDRDAALSGSSDSLREIARAAAEVAQLAATVAPRCKPGARADALAAGGLADAAARSVAGLIEHNERPA